MLALFLVPLILMVGVVLVERVAAAAVVCAVLITLTAGAGFVSAILSLARSRDGILGMWARTVVALLGVCGNAAMFVIGAVIAATPGGGRGRQVRQYGKVLLPPLAKASPWSYGAGVAISVPSEARRVIAHAWRENGRTEHASIAAFARLTLDLVALGAPPTLITASQRDALDETRHAELCFQLARRIDGDEEGPAAFPEVSALPALGSLRSATLAVLAVNLRISA